MFSLIRNWWDQRIIQRSPITRKQWHQAIERLAILASLSAEEKDRLIRSATLFLHYKSIEGAQGLEINRNMRLSIALQACLPILQLGINWYRGWVSVIVYPGPFKPHRTYIDEHGLEHQSQATLLGESWDRGPVILSWPDADQSGELDGFNLLIHEFAHKLDALNGRSNGFPPLHREMDIKVWTHVFSKAYEDFSNKIDRFLPTAINEYAAESPAEFFAVFSEVFFEKPEILHRHYPEVYEQLTLFYRQHPLDRATI